MRFRNGTQKRSQQQNATTCMAINWDSEMELKKIPNTPHKQHGDWSRFSNGTQDIPNNHPTLDSDISCKWNKEFTSTALEKRWPGYTTSLAGQKKRKKNFGRAIHIAGHNFAHTHRTWWHSSEDSMQMQLHGDTPRRTACKWKSKVTLS